ncbi:B-cell receptor CD22 [Coregonus clupeaformis]|uniref:B-cell receptor CD22 n=1 Tax=Coregonus clupeaformis TaxID=59861 RepID=UPI001E1C3857|nr:B-cell receptor CD22 [Coregonus clupeaformis]
MALRTAGSVLLVFLWSVAVVLGQDGWSVTYTPQSICTLKGSTVELSCSYTYPSGTVTTTFWFTKMYAVENYVSLSDDPDYKGRVTYRSDKKNVHTLTITDLRESDSATYKFRLITDQTGGRYTGDPGVTLSVTALQVVTTLHWSKRKTLTCSTTSCPLTGNPTYTWYKNGQIVTEKTSSYSVDSKAADSYSCAVKGHEDLHSPAVCVQGQSCKRVTYTKRRICALKGSTVDISCTYVGYYSTISTFWFRSDRLIPKDLTKDPEYFSRALERGHSTLTITDLREEDSAEYRFTFKKWNNFEWGHSFPGTTLTVTDLQVKVTPDTVSEGHSVTLTCSTTCTLTDKPNPTYIWYKNGQRLDEPTSQQYPSKMVVWDSSVNSYSCAVEGYEGLHSPVVCFQVKVTHIRWATSKTLTCSSTCILTGNPTYIWYKNGQHLDESTYKVKYSVSSNYEDSYSCAVKGHEDLHSPGVCVQGQDCNRVTYTKRRICALKGSTVDISCTYVGYYYPTSTFWFRSDRLIPKDLTKDPEYFGRALERGHTTLIISDLREEDSAEYRFIYKNKYNFEWGHSFPGTKLTVTGLQVKVIPAAEGQKTLTCSTTCPLTDNPKPTYIWYKNGHKVKEDSSSSYSVYFSDADSYSCTVKGHEGLSSPAVYKPKNTSVSVSPSGEIVEGSSVTLTCSSDANPPVQSYTWWYRKNGDPYQRMTGPHHVFNQIQSSDIGEYYCEAQNEIGKDRSTTINMDVKYGPKNTSVSVSPSGEIVEGSSVTLTCSSDANPPVNKYTWYFQNKTFQNGFGQIYNISNFKSKDNGHYHCEAWNGRGSRNSTVLMITLPGKQTSVMTAAVGIIVVVLVLIFCLSGFMWFRKKASKSTSDTRDTSENVQGDSSPVYDNISSMAMTPTAKQRAATVDQDDVHYASVHFSRSKNQEVPLYSTVQLPQPQKQDEDVQYAAVKFNRPSAATPPAAAQAAEEDSSEIYSRVNYPEPRRPENKSDTTPVYLDLYSPTK